MTRLMLGASMVCVLCAGAAHARPSVQVTQALALRQAGLDAERLHGHLARIRWAAAVPEVRFRVVHDADRDGRTTVRFADTAWLGDVAAVDTRGEGLRLQGEVLWTPGALLGSRDELAALKELRMAAAARRGLLEAVTAAWFARERALLDRAQASTEAETRAADLALAEQTAILDGLTGGRFSAGGE